MITRIRNKIWYYYNLGKYKSLGKGSIISSPLKVEGKKNICIGNCVIIKYKSWIASLPLTGSVECLLEFGDGCSIGNFNHIFATQKVVLGKNVLTADKVYISDNVHSFENILIPIKNQPILQNGEVYIGDGSWIGENACILGCSIGKNCVIGANAVVTKDVPDYSVVVGIPARIIKRYSLEEGIWRKTDFAGKFID